MKTPLFLLFVFFTTLIWAQEATPSSTAPTEVPPTSVSMPVSGTTPAPTVTAIASEVPMSTPTGTSSEKSSYHNYSSVHVDGPYIAISFDDGPNATLTPRLLDILKQRNIKATFFVIGENAAQHPEILARAAAEGHEIGNHTWSHPALTKLSDARVQEEVTKTSEAIEKAIGKKPTLLRPPYGAINPRLSRMIKDQDGLTIVLWSVDPMDWKRPGSAVVSQRLLAGAKPGAITLSHDIHPGTVDAMPATLDALIAKGYKFVTVSELIAMETPAPTSTVQPAAPPHKKRNKKST